MYYSLGSVSPGRNIHRRGTEFAEIGEFFDQEVFTLRPPRLHGPISESCLRLKSEDRKFRALTQDPRLETRDSQGDRSGLK